MKSINTSQILLLLLIFYSVFELTFHLKTPLLKSLIQRRQLLDGTAKSGGVAPKPPGSDDVFDHNPVSSSSKQSTINQMLSITTTSSTATPILIRDAEEDRSIKDTMSSTSNSKSSLLASILAPTGVVGLLGAVLGAFLYKKNQTNPMNSGTGGFFSNFFSGNTNAIESNKSDEKYLLVGNISYSSSAGVALLDNKKKTERAFQRMRRRFSPRTNYQLLNHQERHHRRVAKRVLSTYLNRIESRHLHRSIQLLLDMDLFDNDR